jgi:hypothetical protein
MSAVPRACYAQVVTARGYLGMRLQKYHNHIDGLSLVQIVETSRP